MTSTPNALDERIAAIMGGALNMVKRLGQFEGVLFHEPKAAPSPGSAALWLDRIRPITSSGLAAVSAVMVLNCRLYASFNADPADSIDVTTAQRAAALIGAFAGEFTLPDPAGDALVRNVDIFGTYGFALDATAGYVNQDGQLYRVMTVVIPLVINDLWAEVSA